MDTTASNSMRVNPLRLPSDRIGAIPGPAPPQITRLPTVETRGGWPFLNLPLANHAPVRYSSHRIMRRSYENEYGHIERNHWWFIARRRLVLGLFRRALVSTVTSSDAGPKPPAPLNLLDVGCGSGLNLAELWAHYDPYGVICGIEHSERMLEAASDDMARLSENDLLEDIRKRYISKTVHGGSPAAWLRPTRPIADLQPDKPPIAVYQGSAVSMPFKDQSFDVVTCLDVLEHVDDDCSAASELLRVTRNGGTLIVSAPAFMSLWGPHDIVNQHIRRYRRPQLLRLFPGCSTITATYWNCAGFPMVYLRRRIKEAFSKKPSHDFVVSHGIVNAIMSRLLRIESAIILRGARLPFGSSVFAVLRKQDADTKACTHIETPPENQDA